MFGGFCKKRKKKYYGSQGLWLYLESNQNLLITGVEGKITGLSSATKDEKIVENMAHEESCTETVTIEVRDEENCSKTSSPRHGNSNINKEEEELESAKAEMGEVKEENERLRKMLDKIENDYRSLQTHFFDILHQDPPPKPTDRSQSNEFERPEVSLCLGKSPVESRISKENAKRSADPKVNVSDDGLTLGLDLKCPSETAKSEMVTADPSPETQETKEDELGKTWPPSKVLRTSRSETREPPEPNIAKRARVSIRSRCETPTMNDGCQWRKYGQKTAKGNPCPRAYYRCTIAPSCPVAATAMASTTSAAASILISRSSTSQGLGSCSAPATATTANINGFNFTVYDNSTTRPFNFPHASSLAPPTITLDLTTNPSNHLINRFSQAPKFSLTSLDFTSTSEPIKFPAPWRGSSYLNYNRSSQYNQAVPIGTLDFANKKPNGSTGHLTNTQSSSPNQQLLTDKIAEVLTSAPSFQHAVAAAISNMVGSGNFTNSWRASNYAESTMHGSMGNGDQNHQVSSTNSTFPQTRKACFTSFFSNPPQSTSPAPASSSASAGSFGLLQPLLPFAPSKGSSSIAPNMEANSNRKLEM